jgi:hypothetical protein
MSEHIFMDSKVEVIGYMVKTLTRGFRSVKCVSGDPLHNIETEFEMFIDNLKYFYDKYLHWTGKVDEKISSKYKIVATLDRDLMINETEILGNVVKLQGMVSQETLDNNNPYVESHSIEQARREAEAEKNAETDNLFKFDKNEENIDNKVTEEIPVEAE